MHEALLGSAACNHAKESNVNHVFALSVSVRFGILAAVHEKSHNVAACLLHACLPYQTPTSVASALLPIFTTHLQTSSQTHNHKGRCKQAMAHLTNALPHHWTSDCFVFCRTRNCTKAVEPRERERERWALVTCTLERFTPTTTHFFRDDKALQV